MYCCNQQYIMPPNPGIPAAEASEPGKLIRRVLGISSFFTMLMTIPQVLKIWIGHQAAGVSLLSWSAYLLSAILWFWHGLRRGDKNIYLPCIGWAGLDGAVIIGAVLYG